MKIAPVTIIVLNWNGRALLDTCLSSLGRLDPAPARIILADNDSSDDSVAFVQRTFPQVEILPTGGNLGYAGGNNAALRTVDTDWAAIVNPDVVLPTHWLETMISAVVDPTIGIAGCTLTYPDGTLQHTGGSITMPRALPQQVDSDAPKSGLIDVDYATGAALLIRRDCWQQIGLLDDGFFMYFEEVDWCRRAQAADWRTVVVAEAVAIHDESALAGKGSPSYLRRFHAGRWRYLLKHTSAETLRDATIPAEQAWLADMGPVARDALADVYRDALVALPDTLAARVRDGGSPISAEIRPIQIGLANLWHSVAVAPAADWQARQAVANVVEQPFTSSLPLVAKLRSAWANVSTRWFVRPLTSQQNQVNQTLLAELRQSEMRLRQQAKLYLAQDTASAEIAAEQAELQAELAELERLLDALEKRLGRE